MDLSRQRSWAPHQGELCGQVSPPVAVITPLAGQGRVALPNNLLLFTDSSCFFLLPRNNAELHSSRACPRLVRFIIFTRLQLCHLHFLSCRGTICFVKLAEGKAADAAVLQSGRVRICAAGASCLLVLWIISSFWNKRSTFSASAGEYKSSSASPLSKGQWCPTIWHNRDGGGPPPLGVCGKSLHLWAV